MIFEYIYPDSHREKVVFEQKFTPRNSYKYIQAKNKRTFIEDFLPSFISGQKMVLFDPNHKQLVDFYKIKNINSLATINEIDAQLLFFTSGSSGFPLGAFKSKKNLEEEVLVLKKMIQKRKIKKVIVTVPFVHIYGVLAGLLLPFYLDDITLVVKEDFLPYELAEEASSGECLIVTTPVFIKALGRLEEDKDLSSSIFFSSTGPLHNDDINVVEQKYKTTIMQLFGSTETGGIAYKFGSSSQWTPLENVTIESKNEKLCVTSPFVSNFILGDNIKRLILPFQTEDIIEADSNGFTLLGRSNKIIKIAGKRIAAQAIEKILETIPDIKKAVVSLVYKKDLLRSEQILIRLESSVTIKKVTIKKKLNESYGVLTIPFTVEYVEKINISAMGKKVIF